MQSLLCGIIYGYIRNVRSCGPFTISCGSIIAESNIQVVERDDDYLANAAAANHLQFLQQISSILNDSLIGMSMGVLCMCFMGLDFIINF